MREVLVVVAMVVVLADLVGAVGVVVAVVLGGMDVPVRTLVVAVVDAAVTRPGRAMLDSSAPSLDEAHAAATTEAATTSKGRHVRRTTSATVATTPSGSCDTECTMCVEPLPGRRAFALVLGVGGGTCTLTPPLLGTGR